MLEGCSATDLVHRSRAISQAGQRTLAGRFCSACAYCGIPSSLCQEVLYEKHLSSCPVFRPGHASVPLVVASCTPCPIPFLGGGLVPVSTLLVLLVVFVVIVGVHLLSDRT